MEVQVTLTDIKVELADAILEASALRRELVKTQKELTKVQQNNEVHKDTIERLQARLEPQPTEG